MRTPRKLSVALFACGLTVAALACGSRTGLLADGPWEPEPEEDAALEAPVRRFDAQVRDVGTPYPGLDARPDVIVDQRDCKDPAETQVYVIGADNQLYAFDPREYAARVVGEIACPTTGGGSPYSMAVDRQGVAYVVFQDIDLSGKVGPDHGKLFRIGTRTAACAATSYQPIQQGIAVFGMGFVSDTGGAAETLFIATNRNESTLGFIALPSFELRLVDDFEPEILEPELTGTGDGRLFAFYSKSHVDGSFVGEIQKTTGRVVGEMPLPTVTQQLGWAFAFWGGDFFTFTGNPNGTSTVHRARPADGSVVEVAQIPSNIVGAGVSTCSPVE